MSDLELDRHSALSDANCASDHSDWRPAKPRMQEKLLAADLQVGMFMSFTEDGWNTFKYKMTEEYKDCILFRHYQNRYRSLLFKKVGGPVLSFDCVDDQSDGITCKSMMSATGEQFSSCNATAKHVHRILEPSQAGSSGSSKADQVGLA